MASKSNIGSDIRSAVESIRDAVMSSDFGRFASNLTKGESHADLRASILTAVTDEPKNGHQIMQAIGEASNGEWMPAASHVYPLLAQLTDEGLLSAKVKGERTTYTLTDAGREALASATEDDSPTSANHGSTSKMMRDWKMPKWDDANAAVPKAGAKLAQAAAQVAQSGSRDQKERAAALLDETRRKLYAILAED
ncbi:MAG: PadR family transcriptional regulator [Actinobacteria bacterium]|jgi:DNA-binding PadR family transcriptional regulator|nr:PadR family transcriptional regulator [Actinomycetota bacterium]